MDLVCPFNTDHKKLLTERFQFHLVRCSKQHKHVDVVICPFNATHIVKHKDLFKHVDELCENRIVFERSLQSLADSEIPIGIVPASVEVPIPDSEENWDEEVVVVPVKHVINENVKKKAVMTNLVGQCSSERKKHKAEERERHAELNKKK